MNASFTCLSRQEGVVECHGDDSEGQRGDGDVGDGVVAVDEPLQLASGLSHACAVSRTGRVFCWGGNDFGQLGAGVVHLPMCGSRFCSDVPLEVADVDDAQGVAAGFDHTCIVRTDGRVACWGSNDLGQVGVTGIPAVVSPIDVDGLPDADPAMAVAAQGNSSCALLASGDVWCWGAPFGRGDEDTGDPDPMLTLGISDAVQVSMTNNSMCARLGSGRVRCIGGNEDGELGNGETADSLVFPVNVTYLSDARDLGCGEAHCCATRTSGQTVCWGRNDLGELAIPTTGTYRTPATTVDLVRLPL